MALYQENKINPLAGCLPQILQLVLLIILYRGLLHFFGLEQVAGITINPHFYGSTSVRLTPTMYCQFWPGLSQFGLSWLMMGYSQKSEQKKKRKIPEGSDMASMMQKQMLYIMPIFSAFIALRLPSGLVLYWVISTAVMQSTAICQQISGKRRSWNQYSSGDTTSPEKNKSKQK